MVPGAVAELFGLASGLPEALGFPLLYDTADFPAIRIVFDADAHIAKPFSVHEGELLAGQFPGAVQNVLGLGEAADSFKVPHEQKELKG
jgi:hypothetical protein